MLLTIPNEPPALPAETPNAAARRRLLSQPAEVLFFAGWENVLMIHFEVEADSLQRDVPFELDLYDGRALVSVVAFTMRGLRPRFGGGLASWLLRPIATHDFLNVRTYVRHHGEVGIHFLAEWLSNRLAVRLGPRTFSLPYRYGRTAYDHDWRTGIVQGRVVDAASGDKLLYHGKLTPGSGFQPCEAGSPDEWLMERYVAINSAGKWKRAFQVWHPPWQRRPVTIQISDAALLKSNWPWFDDARLMSAGFSRGFPEVWMSKPRKIFEAGVHRPTSPARL